MKLSDKLLRAYLFIPALEDQSLAGLEYLGEWAGEATELLEALEALLYFVDDTPEADEWKAVVDAREVVRKAKA